MLARTSFRELAHRPLRTFLALAGVAVSSAMLVDMIMLGSGIERSFADLLSGRGYELRIAPKGTLPFDTEATIPAFSEIRGPIAAVDGVDGVAPVLATAVEVRAPAGGSSPERAFALGVDPAEQGIYRVIEGDRPSSGEVVVDESWTRAGVAVGDTLTIVASGGFGVVGRTSEVVVAAVAEFFYSAQGDAPVALDLTELQRLAGRTDEVSFVMARTSAAADVERVRRDLAAAVDRVEVVSLSGIVDEASERLSYFRQLALILGTVSLLVASLLVGTIMAVSVSERLGTIAALRAIGISRARILGGLTAESVLLCAVGGAAGLGLGVAVAGYLESILSDFPGLPEAVRFFVLRPESLGYAYLSLLIVGALAGFLPAWRATQLEVATLLHTEEP